MAIRVSNITGQVLFNPGVYYRAVEDTLTLQQETAKRGLVVSNVTVQSLIEATPSLGAAISHEFNFASNVVHFLAISDREVPENTLDLTQTAYVFGYEDTSHDLGLTDSIDLIGPINIDLFHNLAIHDGVNYCYGASTEPYVIEDILHFKHYTGIGHPESVTDVISFTDAVYRIWTFEQSINFNQDTAAGRNIIAENTLELVSTLYTDNLLTVSIVHPNFLEHALAYYVDNSCAKKLYNKFEGTGEASGIPEEPLTFDADFVLESLSGTKESLILRKPETDDRQRIGFQRINRETMGGELNVFSDTNWPKVHSLLFTIVALSNGDCLPDKIGDLMTFFQDHLGEEILLHDWEGISWRGVITTPNEVATEDRDGWWTISFEFQGEALDGSQGDQKMEFAQTIGMNADWSRSLSDDIGLLDAVIGTILGTIAISLSDDLGMTDTVEGVLEHKILEDDFSGAGAALDGTSPDVGSSVWSAHANYKDNGTQTAINSGAYYPFAPESGHIYTIEWETSAIAENDGDEIRCFLGEGLNADPDNVGATAYGNADPTTLKAGFILRTITTQRNACRLGDDYDGLVDTADFDDATLKTEDDAIDLRLVLDTTGGAGNWTVAWYAKDPLDSTWTQVRSEADLLSEDITMVGWSNNNTNTTITMDDIRIIEEVSI